MDEIWRPVVGYEGKYDVSNHGRIKSIRRDAIMAQTINSNRCQVQLSGVGKPKTIAVHRIVAIAFLPTDNMDIKIVRHKNEDKYFNYVTNLEWLTRAESEQRNISLGIRGALSDETKAKISRAKKGGKHQTGQLNSNAILKPYQVREIRSMDKDSWPSKMLSEMYGVKPDTINRIRNRKTWKHIR